MKIDGVEISLDNLFQDLLELVVGEKWPDGDEGAMRQLANAWTTAATALAEVQRTADSAAKAVARYRQGAAAESFQAFWSSNFDDGQTSWPKGSAPAALPFAVQFCRAMATTLNNGATQIETTKDTIIGNVTILVATVAPQLVAGFFDLGATDATAVAEVTAERTATEIFLQGVKELLVHLAEQALEQGLQQAELNFVIQAKEWAEGETDGISWKQVGASGLGGVEGGALGAGFGKGIGSLGGKVFGDAFGDSAAGRITTGVMSGQLTNASLDFAQNGTISASDFTKGSAAGFLGGFGGGHSGGGDPDLTVDTDDLPNVDELPAVDGLPSLTNVPDTTNLRASADSADGGRLPDGTDPPTMPNVPKIDIPKVNTSQENSTPTTHEATPDTGTLRTTLAGLDTHYGPDDRAGDQQPAPEPRPETGGTNGQHTVLPDFSLSDRSAPADRSTSSASTYDDSRGGGRGQLSADGPQRPSDTSLASAADTRVPEPLDSAARPEPVDPATPDRDGLPATGKAPQDPTRESTPVSSTDPTRGPLPGPDRAQPPTERTQPVSDPTQSAPESAQPAPSDPRTTGSTDSPAPAPSPSPSPSPAEPVRDPGPTTSTVATPVDPRTAPGPRAAPPNDPRNAAPLQPTRPDHSTPPDQSAPRLYGRVRPVPHAADPTARPLDDGRGQNQTGQPPRGPGPHENSAPAQQAPEPEPRHNPWLVPRKTLGDSRPTSQAFGLKPVEPEYQRVVENSVPRNPDGSPAVHPAVDGRWVGTVNDGGPRADPGRGNNCVDCTRAGLATYYGDPHASAARYFELNEHGLQNMNGEVGGIQNMESWTGARYSPDGNGAAGLQSVEAKVRAAGPGSSAAVVVEWPWHQDRNSGQMVPSGSHQIAIINDGGTVKWVDFQSRAISETFPGGDVQSVTSIVLDANRNPIVPAVHIDPATGTLVPDRPGPVQYEPQQPPPFTPPQPVRETNQPMSAPDPRNQPLPPPDPNTRLQNGPTPDQRNAYAQIPDTRNPYAHVPETRNQYAPVPDHQNPYAQPTDPRNPYRPAPDPRNPYAQAPDQRISNPVDSRAQAWSTPDSDTATESQHPDSVQTTAPVDPRSRLYGGAPDRPVVESPRPTTGDAPHAVDHAPDPAPTDTHTPTHTDTPTRTDAPTHAETRTPSDTHTPSEQRRIDPRTGLPRQPMDPDLVRSRVAEASKWAVARPDGLAAFADPRVLEQARRVPEDPNGAMTIDMHSDGDGMFVGLTRLDEHGVYELAKANGLQDGQPIRLLGCEAGKDGNGLAARLAEVSGHPVIAADTFVFTDDVGHVFASDGVFDAHGQFVPEIPPTGRWHEFGPDGTRTPLSDSGFPPGYENEGFGNWRAPVRDVYARTGTAPGRSGGAHDGPRGHGEPQGEPHDGPHGEPHDDPIRSQGSSEPVKPAADPAAKAPDFGPPVHTRPLPDRSILEGPRPDRGTVPPKAVEDPADSQRAGFVDADGNWTSGNNPEFRLTADQRGRLAGFLARGSATEARATGLLLGIEDRMPDARLSGLENRQKLIGSLSDKVAGKLRGDDSETVDTVLPRINDSVRYTLCMPEAGYVDGVHDAVSTLSEHFALTKYGNAWGGEGYQGINSTWTDPETGMMFEVQFHTPDSLYAKEFETHEWYERQRVLAEGDPLAKQFAAWQNDAFSKVPRPDGAVGLDLRAAGATGLSGRAGGNGRSTGPGGNGPERPRAASPPQSPAPEAAGPDPTRTYGAPAPAPLEPPAYRPPSPGAAPRAHEPSPEELKVQRTTAAKAALADELAPVNPHTSAVVSRLLDDKNALNLTDRLRDPQTRSATITTLQEISASHLLDDHTLTEYLEEHPGQGPLFEPVTHEENFTADGAKRVDDYVARAKAAEPVRAIGAGQAARLHAHLEQTDRGTQVPDLSPEDSRALAQLENYSAQLTTRVLPTAVQELRGIIATLPPGTDVAVNARAKNARGLVDKVGRMAGGWQGRAPRPDYQVGEVIDAVGVRITVGSAADLSHIFATVKDRFGAGDGGRVLEIENMYAKPKRNNKAYRVVPLVVSIEVDHVPYTYELQLTTRRASVAADMEHNSVYKDYISATPAEADAVIRAMAEAAAIEQTEAGGR
jgi:ppGpp synthetase/RelA/SpoT-type nucleotidyltranferase